MVAFFTETTFEWPEEPQAPGTYAWHWDGSVLSFELWGDELQRNRYATYALYPLRLVDVITDMMGYRGRTAAVLIERGEPITPDMLEPPSE